MQTSTDIPGISCGLVGNNIFEWEVMLMISDDCKFYGGRPTLPSRPTKEEEEEEEEEKALFRPPRAKGGRRGRVEGRG